MGIQFECRAKHVLQIFGDTIDVLDRSCRQGMRSKTRILKATETYRELPIYHCASAPTKHPSFGERGPNDETTR